jgi:hypothetical protein
MQTNNNTRKNSNRVSRYDYSFSTADVKGLRKILRGQGHLIVVQNTGVILAQPEQYALLFDLAKTKIVTVKRKENFSRRPRLTREEVLSETLRGRLKLIHENFLSIIGWNYNRYIKAIVASDEASINIGRGSSSEKDWNYYAKSYGYPKTYKNAGIYFSAPGVVEIEPVRGKKIQIAKTFSIKEMATIARSQVLSGALLDMELYGITLRNGVVERYNAQGEKTGIAVLIRLVNGQEVWEHGKTFADIKRERDTKNAILRAAELKKAHSLEMERAKRLVLRCVKNAEARFEDARAVGYCQAGIESFCNRHGYDVKSKLTLAQLRQHNETYALQNFIAERCAVQIIQRQHA